MPGAVISNPTSLRAQAGALLLVERRLADEVVFLPADDPSQIGLEHGRGLVDVLAGQVHAGLEPQRVARAKADRHDAGVGACFENRIPHALGRCRRNEQLEAVLARVAGSRDDAAHARHFAVREPVGT